MVRGATRDDELLEAIEWYCDAAPRAAARAEEIGPLTLFVNEGPGWPYYARPMPGSTTFAAAWVEGAPVAVGSHQPVGGVSEVVGVATLPAFRRRGDRLSFGRRRGRGAGLRAARLPPARHRLHRRAPGP